MFEAIARFSVKFRWFIIIAWIVAVPVLTAHLPNINNVTKNDNSQFLPKNSPSTQAINLESGFQSKNTSATATIVAVRQSGSLTPSDNQTINTIAGEVGHMHGVSQVHNQGESADGDQCDAGQQARFRGYLRR